MTIPTWTTNAERVAQSNIDKVMNNVNVTAGLQVTSYQELHAWSLGDPGPFWQSLARLVRILADRDAGVFIDNPTQMPSARFFSGTGLNFTEDLLRREDDHASLFCE